MQSIIRFRKFSSTDKISCLIKNQIIILDQNSQITTT